MSLRLLAAGLLATPLLCQGRLTPSVPPPAAASAFAPFGALRLRVPIHTAPDDPAAGAYGLWTAAESFKASFHDGFAFYPYVQGQARARAWHWRATQLNVGGEPVGLTKVHGKTSAWQHAQQHTWHHGAQSGHLTETYDVVDAGIEQSFVLHERLPFAGEVVITGRLETPFVAEVRAPAVAPLTFCDGAGVPVVSYGKALAFDAAGARIDVPVSFDGSHIHLHVSADFLAAAAFPVTVDPLTSAVLVNAATSGPVRDTAIACSWQQGDFNMVVACVREFASGDFDAYAYRTTDTSTSAGTLIFADATTTWSTVNVDAAVISADLAWVLAIQRNLPSRAVRLYTHAISSSTLNSGTTFFPPADIERDEPRVGGNHGSFVGGRHALVVFTEYPLTGPTVVKGTVLDTQAGLGSAFDLYAGAPPNRDNRSPSVNASAHVVGMTAEPWCVTWVEDNGAGAFDVKVSVVGTNGVPLNTRTVLSGPSARGPRIAGCDGGYLLTWVETPMPLTAALRVARIAMTTASYARLADRTLSTAAAGRFLLQGDVAFDFITNSHFAVTYTVTQLVGSPVSTIARLGLGLSVLESSTLDPGGTLDTSATDVAFTGEPHPMTRAGFPCSYTTDEANHPLRWRRLDYDAGALVTLYGASCSGNPVYVGHPPFAGSQNFKLSVSGLPANAPAFLFVGFAPLDVPLDFLGMTGCRLLLDSVLTMGAANVGGVATATLPLPENPLFLGDLYTQWAWLEPGANPLGVINSRGLRAAVR